MKHLKIYESNKGLSYGEFTDILMYTPTYYPVFVLIDDFEEEYTGDLYTIPKGTEVYVEDSNRCEFYTLDNNHILTEIDEGFLKFVEYRNKKDIDKEVEIYTNAKKYNI